MAEAVRNEEEERKQIVHDFAAEGWCLSARAASLLPLLSMQVSLTKKPWLGLALTAIFATTFPSEIVRWSCM
jgi:hypothetical protein